MVIKMQGPDVIIKERRIARAAFQNLILFSILMMLGPVTAYFAARNFYIEHYDGENGEWNPEHIGAIAAVIVVHVVMGTFCYVAFTEDVGEDAEENLRVAKNRLEQLKAYVEEVEREKEGAKEEALDKVLNKASEVPADTNETTDAAEIEPETKKDQ